MSGKTDAGALAIGQKLQALAAQLAAEIVMFGVVLMFAVHSYASRLKEK